MNINYYIDRKFSGNSKELIEKALATICINAKKHMDYTNGVERFFKNLEV